MVWRRRRVGKTTQLISFILILTNVTSNNHTHMVCADVTSTSFADKLCLHISTPAAYMTVPLLSGYRLVVFRVLHGIFFRIRDKSAHDYCCFDVPMQCRKFVSLCYKWCYQTMCNSGQKLFPFYLLVRLIFAHVVCIYDQCIYCSNVDHAIKHCHCPSASCWLYCVPCIHLIQHVYCREN